MSSTSSTPPPPAPAGPSLRSISPTPCPRSAHPAPPRLNGERSEAVLTKILELEEIDTNMYRGYSPAAPRWGRIYGGQTVAQALVASCRTVEPHFVVHSLHSYFLRPGNDDFPIMYYVERLRNGKSFCSRRVTAMQKGQAIFAMNASFMTLEAGREHQDKMPEVPPPEQVQTLKDSYLDFLNNPRLTERIRRGITRSMDLPFPVEMRRVTPASFDERMKPEGLPPIQRCWMRVEGQLSDSLMLHQCALAYMSDWSLLETSLLPHGMHGWVRGEDGSSLQMASIDHAMWFHAPFRADEWLLYDMDSPAASGGRGFTRGRFFTCDGKLIVSTAQEGLIRVHKGPPPPIRPIGSSLAVAAKKGTGNSTTTTTTTTTTPAPAAGSSSSSTSSSSDKKKKGEKSKDEGASAAANMAVVVKGQLKSNL